VMEKYDTDTMPQHQQWTWQQLSPQNLDHRVQIPTAITLHRLVPKTPTTAAASKHKLRISLLERKSYIEDKNGSRYLRMLAVSTRTLHRILLALKTHAENAFVCASGKKLFVELTAMTHRLFSLVTSVGVRAPRLSAQVIQKGEHLSEDSSTEVVSSDIDSDALSILQPHLVRHRIATLARHRLKKKRRMKQKVTMQMPVTNKKDRIASETAVHLLQKNKGSVDNISEGPMDHSRVTAAASTRPTNNQSQASNIISSHDYKGKIH
ncbi:hypothetical protein OTU49_002397, partial [Cherax quadricarinatus]